MFQLRKDLLALTALSPEEQERIVHEGTISLNFWNRDDVQQLLQDVTSRDTRKAEAVNVVANAAGTLQELLRGKGSFPPIAMFPPATASVDDLFWHQVDDLAGTIPSWAADVKAAGQTVPTALPNYDVAKLEPAVQATMELIDAWRKQNVEGTNFAITALTTALPNVNPAVYPSETKRHAEVVYNKLANLTVPGASLYFIAFICFVMASRSGVVSLRLWGLRLFLLAFFVHTAGIAIRWWLVGSIPDQE